MLDDYKKNNGTAYNFLKSALENNKISHAYLIETLENNNGFNFAISFAKALLCPKRYTNKSNCGDCNQCDLIDNNNYIELEIVETKDLWLKKENIDKLQNDFTFKPVIGKRKIYIIKDAEKIKENLSNTLLKFIEEPEEGIVAILVTDNKSRILDTIVSRCQVISLKPENDYQIDKTKYCDELVINTLNFVNYYEENKIESLIYIKSIFHDFMKDRSDYILAFDVILMFYNDILNYKIYNKFNIFEKYMESLNYNFIEKISVENILNKIDIVIKLKKFIVNNVNLNLIMDKLIIKFEKVDSDEIC